MNTFIFILSASLLVSLVSFSGSVLLIRKELLKGEIITYLVSFAAGVLLATAFYDLLPEAAEEAAEVRRIFLFTLYGVVIFFFLERAVLWFHHHDETHGAKPSALLILLGDGLHNFIDGVTIAAAYLTSPAVGLTTTLAIVVHEVPQEIADFSVLVAGGMKRTKALFFNFFSGLTALIGAVSGFYFLESLRMLLPAALSFAAGMFIYIACADLIPDLHKDFYQRKGWTHSFLFILGLAATSMIVRLLEG